MQDVLGVKCFCIYYTSVQIQMSSGRRQVSCAEPMCSLLVFFFFLSLLISLEAVLALPFYFCEFCATGFSFYV